MNPIQDLLATYEFPVYLAPMEEVTDPPFRGICKEFGADILISEFISSDALSREVEKSIKKMHFGESERPFGIQIFGHDEESLIAAAKIAESASPDFIDINWGCPVRKVVTKGAGSAILKDIPKMVRLTKAVVEAVKLPVTVKTRLGWEENDKPIVEAAEMLQDVGISAITIHGRTRAQMYGEKADWTLIGKVKNNPRMTIPVIGNGDIDSAEKAVELRQRYGVDAIMVGRAAIGNPWIFKQIKDYLQGKIPILPDYDERVRVCMRHLKLEMEWKGERSGILEMRKHYANYFKGIPHFKEKKIRLMGALSYEECQNILTNS